MNRWRVALIGLLICTPVLVWIGIGWYALWRSGYGFILWWPLFACASLGYFLAWHWLRRRKLLPSTDAASSLQWTDRDREAWQLVLKEADRLAGAADTQFHDLSHYSQATQELTHKLAQFYHPHDRDPLGSVTVPEVLAVFELASQDLAEMVDQQVPGSHLMTINHWRRTHDLALKATAWYNTSSGVWWAGAALIDPIATALKYAATQAGMTMPLQGLQTDLIAWLHRAYVERLGYYLIELHSGRLRVGAKRYRELQHARVHGPGADQPVELVTLTVFGQAKVGKSSLINALLGAQQAQTDVTPCTDGVTRYELPLEGTPTRLVLLDTVGYSQAGARQDQVEATRQAAQQSDLLILVLHARNPARQGDLEMLRELSSWFAPRPHLKRPPILAVVTHIDLLSPAMEWSPPYDWQHPTRPKEQHIHDALATVRDQLGIHLARIVPACTAAGKAYGIDDWVMAALIELLGDARAVAMLRCLHNERDADKVWRVAQQTLSLGGRLLDAYLHRNDPSRPPFDKQSQPGADKEGT